MGTTGHPGLVFAVECTSNNGHVVTFSGDGVSISVAGPPEKLEYFESGTNGTVHFQFPSGSKPDGGDLAESAG